MQWIYSRFKYFDDYVVEWERTLVRDIADRQQIESRLAQLEQPFGFLNTLKEEAEDDVTDDDNEENQDPDKKGTATAVN